MTAATKALSLLRRMRSFAGLWPLVFARDGAQTLHHCDLLQSACRAGLPTIDLAALLLQVRGAPLGNDERIVLHPNLRGTGSGSVAEMAAISSLVAARHPRSILELGTCDGCSTWHLFANSGADTVITTLDLPINVKVEGSTDENLQGITQRPFLPNSPRVRLIEIDSRLWKPDIPGGVDLCFIDAGHSYECVRNDTEKALSVMNPGGLLLWHDATWKRSGYGVNRYLKELLAKGLAVRLVQIGPFDYSGLAACVI